MRAVRYYNPVSLGRWAKLLLAFLLIISLKCDHCSTRQPRHHHIDTGLASYYGQTYHGRVTASGESFDMTQLTAAHRTYAFGTIVRVTRLDNKCSVEVRINDRGPFVSGRIIDLSPAAARQLDMIQAGIAEVTVEPLNAAEFARETRSRSRHQLFAFSRPKPRINNK